MGFLATPALLVLWPLRLLWWLVEVPTSVYTKSNPGLQVPLLDPALTTLAFLHYHLLIAFHFPTGCPVHWLATVMRSRQDTDDIPASIGLKTPALPMPELHLFLCSCPPPPHTSRQTASCLKYFACELVRRQICILMFPPLLLSPRAFND
ncbi:hypothetical protein C8R43DRAFT_1114182 [Mycena crocata]|nr:hypothetical protein C8R43DRAFT_1114182 [Mycena crocata]